MWEKYDKELGGTEMKPGDDQSLLDMNHVTQLLSSVSFFLFLLTLTTRFDVKDAVIVERCFCLEEKFDPLRPTLWVV